MLTPSKTYYFFNYSFNIIYNQLLKDTFMTVITVKVNDQVNTIAEKTILTQDSKPTVIKAIDKVNYELLNTETNLAPSHIVTKRVDNDIHISFKEGSERPDLIIEGFYNEDSMLIGLAGDGSYYSYIADTGDIAYSATELQIGDTEGQVLGGQSQTNPWWLDAAAMQSIDAAPLLLGLAGAGLIGVASNMGNNSSTNKSITPDLPDTPTSVVVGNGDAFINKEEIDKNGNVDVTIGLPADAVAGSTVIVNGKLQEITQEDIDKGKIVVKVPAPEEGKELEIIAALEDLENKKSEDLTVNVGTVDTIAPDSPKAIVVGNEDGFISKNEIDEEGNVKVSVTLPKGAVAGITIIVNGKEQEVTADDIANGNVVVKVPAAKEGKELEITTSLKDPAGNKSADLKVSAGTVDSIAPDAPSAQVATDGTVITGIAEPSSVIEVDTSGNGKPDYIVTTDKDGSYKVDISANPLLNGEVITITAKDAAGNVSEPIKVAAKDSTAPNMPSINISEDGTAITGTAEAGSIVKVDTTGNGKPNYTATADEEGNYRVDTSNKPLINGELVSVTATDAAGNTSKPMTETAIDITPPNAPTAQVASDGTSISGTAEPGSTVKIDTVGDGKPYYNVTADKDGNYKVDISANPLINGETITVTATDEAGNMSNPTTSVAKNTMTFVASDTDITASGVEVIANNNDSVKKADSDDAQLLMSDILDLYQGNDSYIMTESFNHTSYPDSNEDNSTHAIIAFESKIAINDLLDISGSAPQYIDVSYDSNDNVFLSFTNHSESDDSVTSNINEYAENHQKGITIESLSDSIVMSQQQNLQATTDNFNLTQDDDWAALNSILATPYIG